MDPAPEAFALPRRDFLIGAAAGISALALGQAQAAPATTAPSRPNFLFIFSDQHRFDALGTLNPAVQTPALDRLCKEGLRFERSYVAQAVCTPSRASLMSGLYPHTHKLTDNTPGEDALSDPAFNLGVTWPTLMQKAGYHTGYIGKWHLGTKPGPGFDEWMGFNTSLPHWLGDAQKSRYRSDDETDKGIDFLERNKDKPFVLFQSYYPPHTPFNPPQKYADMYREKFEQPGYWGAVTAIDACIGRLLAKLDELGLAGNTIVIYTSDHGEHFGKRPGNAHKRTAYEESARVPLIVRHPRMLEGGQKRSQLVCNVDLMPTLLDLAGVAIPPGLHGQSLVPAMAGRTPQWRRSVIIQNREDLETGGGDERYRAKKCTSRGVRTERYKLILRDCLPVRATHLRELYDLEADPREQKNLYGKEQAAAIGELLDELEAWAKQTQDETGLKLAAECRADLKA